MATIYKYNDYEYRDESDEFTTEEVKQQLVQYFPELAQAKAESSKDGEGNTVVTFVKRAGTKGMGLDPKEVFARTCPCIFLPTLKLNGRRYRARLHLIQRFLLHCDKQDYLYGRVVYRFWCGLLLLIVLVDDVAA